MSDTSSTSGSAWSDSEPEFDFPPHDGSRSGPFQPAALPVGVPMLGLSAEALASISHQDEGPLMPLCNSCFEGKKPTRFIHTCCNHEICKKCFIRWIQLSEHHDCRCPICRKTFTLVQVLGAQLSGRMVSEATATEFQEIAELYHQHRPLKAFSEHAELELLDSFKLPGPFYITHIERGGHKIKGTCRRPGRGEKESDVDLARMMMKYRQRRAYHLRRGHGDRSVDIQKGLVWETLYGANAFSFGSFSTQNQVDRFSRHAFRLMDFMDVNTLVGRDAQEAFRQLCDQLAVIPVTSANDYRELLLSEDCIDEYLCHSFDSGHRNSLANLPGLIDLVLRLAAKLIFAIHTKGWNFALGGWGRNALRYKWSCPFAHIVPGHRYPSSQLSRTECTQDQKDVAQALFIRKYGEMVESIKNEQNFYEASPEEVAAIIQRFRPTRPDRLSLKRKREAAAGQG
ncbi:hypothetical protein BU16DRAFT_554182 [Lophium mytilinum]|uniref:RING-type domain-containing protein n=1 Tax=Lophium mytilinum TaxID=390894 RepID=A0A6A6RCJ9_9PEZI|nr:hypothetical protein BU16DRAFT_554182 [Lophium mytilinum]